MRLVLTGGVSPNGMHFDPETPTFFIVTHELFDVPASVYVNGAKLLAVEHRRELPEAKTTGYLTWLRHHPRLDAEGAMDLLYHSDGVISEAATASFYVVRDGRILALGAASVGNGGLWVLELASGEFEIVYGDITLDDTLGAEECFLTSSVRGVVPIVKSTSTPSPTARSARSSSGSWSCSKTRSGLTSSPKRPSGARSRSERAFRAVRVAYVGPTMPASGSARDASWN